MPRKLPQSRTATADRIAALLRIYRAAARAGDPVLRDACACVLRADHGLELFGLDPDRAADWITYGIGISLLDPVDLANITPPINSTGVNP